MTAQLTFSNMTLGYDRHPAVHHLDGEVAVRRADRGDRPERRRQVDAVSRAGRGPEAAGGLDRSRRARRHETSPTCRRAPRSTAASRSRSSISSARASGAATGLFGGMGRIERDKIAKALAAVGLNGFENRPIGTLSGGQMQRMLFARVLLQDARLIVLDEPFNAIDAKTSADLLTLISAGTASSARCWRRCTTSSWCATIFRKRCCSRASRWPGARPPRC